MRKTDQVVLDKLWATLGEMGRINSDPRQASQLVKWPEGKLELTKAYLIESLFTGLYTTRPDILIRCWPQAHGYFEVLVVLGEHPGAYLYDVLSTLRDRVESHFLRGE